jgi:hypothetical protein
LYQEICSTNHFKNRSWTPGITGAFCRPNHYNLGSLPKQSTSVLLHTANSIRNMVFIIVVVFSLVLLNF